MNILKLIPLTAAIMIGIDVWSVNPFAVSHYIVERQVPDMTEKYDALASQMKQSSSDLAAMVTARGMLKQLTGYVDQKFPEDLRPAAEALVTYMEENGLPKADKVRKDLAKGKLNKECAPALDKYLSTLNAMIEREDDAILDTRNKIRALESDAIAGDRQLQADGVKMITLYDTVPNPLFNKHMTLDKEALSVFQMADQMEGWMWTLNDALVPYEASYPVRHKYYYFQNHPEYAVPNADNRKFLFDRDGNLVRVVYMTSNDVESTYELLTFIYALAYEKNEYGIQSESQATKHAIKVRAELEGKTQAEKAQDAKRDKAFREGLNATVETRARYGDSWLSDYVDRQAARHAFSEPAGLKYTDEAMRWMKQVENDYMAKLSHPYAVERIDGTNFKVTWADDNYRPIYQGVVSFQKADPIGTSETLWQRETLVSFWEVKGGKPLVTIYPETYQRVTELSNYEPGTAPILFYAAPEVDKLASYGGEKALAQFIANNLKLQETANRPTEVALLFTIETDGAVSDCEVYFRKSANKPLYDNLMSMSASMDRWQPAEVGGRPVRSRVAYRVKINDGGSVDVTKVDDETRQQAEKVFLTPFADSRLKQPSGSLTSSKQRGGIANNEGYNKVYEDVDLGARYYTYNSMNNLFTKMAKEIRNPAGLSGRVLARFIVNHNGLSDIEILSSDVPQLNDEVVRFLKSIKFEPARKDDSPVRSYFTLPIIIEPNGISSIQGASDARATSPKADTGGSAASTDTDKVYEVVEEGATYPGGDAALMKFLSNNLRLPEGEKGRVVVKFVVLANGVVGDVQVTRSVSPALDEAVVKAVKTITGFIPGKNGGIPVNSYYKLPVTVK